MGCATSKLDDLPAVALCRERCTFLDEALRLRFALADAHAAYLQSLKAVGVSLHTFFIQDLDSSAHRPPSPVLNLPSQRKKDPNGHSSSSSDNIHHLHSHSDSGSHLHFHSDSDDDDADSLHHNMVSSPVRNQQSYPGYLPGYENINFNFPGAAAGGGGGGGFMHINYMKNQATPSVVYTQRPMTPKNWHMGESSSVSSSSYPYPSYQDDGNRNPNASYTNYNYSGYQSYPNYGAGGGFYSGSSATPAPYGGGFSSESQTAVASSSKPPPSPPRSSGWDFLNPFEGFEKFYPATTSSRDSRDVREEEGIPDLEDEDDEVVKEVHGHQKFVGKGSSYSKPAVSEADAQGANDAQLQHRSRPKVEMETDPVEYEVHMVDKKVVDADDRSKDQGSASGFKPRGGLKGDLEVVREIQLQFERASESGSELSKFLEVGKLPYKRKHGVNHVSSKMLHLPVVSSQNSTSKGSEINMVDPAYLDADQELETRSRYLSSTLHKLYLWEKKLYDEVKAEEKMRVLHDHKSRKLKHLDERGAEAHKVDLTRTLVRSLSTKIKIAIQVVDKISVKINNLRDDDLWPQLNDFIQGLTTMWKSMLECHRNQCQAIGEAKRLDAIAFRKHFSDAHFEATRQFEHDLVNWTLRFSYWVDAQKGFVRALNRWLRNCLLYVPEETADGIVPFSPGRIGAPPVFVVCHQWWQSLERVSEKEVVGSMRDFASNVLQLWNRDKAEMRQRMLVNKDDRKIKSLDKEDQKIQKEILALDKRMVLLNSTNDSGIPSTGHVVYQSETTKGGSLQASLQHVLEAMEGFTSNSLKVYEELLQRIEEDHLAQEHERVS